MITLKTGSFLAHFIVFYVLLQSTGSRFLPQVLDKIEMTTIMENLMIQSQHEFKYSVAKLEMSFVSNSSEAGKTNFKVILDFGETLDQYAGFIQAYLSEGQDKVMFSSGSLIESCSSLSFPLELTFWVEESSSGIKSNSLSLNVNCQDTASGPPVAAESSHFFLYLNLIFLILLLGSAAFYCYHKKKKQIDYTRSDFQLQGEDDKTNTTEGTDRKMQDEIANYNNKLLKRRRKNRSKNSNPSSDNSSSFDEENNKSMEFPPHETKDDSEKMVNVKELADLSHIHNSTINKPDLSMSYSIVNEIKDGEAKNLFTSDRPIIEELNDE